MAPAARGGDAKISLVRPQTPARAFFAPPPPTHRIPGRVNAQGASLAHHRPRCARPVPTLAPCGRGGAVFHLEDAPRGRPRRDVGVILVAEHDLNTRQG